MDSPGCQPGGVPTERPSRGTILIAEDDPDLAESLQFLLELEGYTAAVERTGAGAIRAARNTRPDLLLLDLGLPDMDGLEVCRDLRSDPRWDSLCILALTARSGVENEVLGLHSGLDGYIEKPYDTGELLARVEAALRQSRRERATNPLTRLPGNSAIEVALLNRLERGGDFAVCYVDIDRFKAYNDSYGFAAGDRAILGLADAIQCALDATGGHGFLGHVGGDDFVVLLDPSDVDRFCSLALSGFDEVIAGSYTPEDLARGSVEVEDRRGILTEIPTMSLSIAVVPQHRGRFSHVGEISRAAAELKTHVKRSGGGRSMVDRRQG